MEVKEVVTCPPTRIGDPCRPGSPPQFSRPQLGRRERRRTEGLHNQPRDGEIRWSEDFLSACFFSLENALNLF